MSVADQITSITSNLTNAYNALEAKGATMPIDKNIANLADTIDTVSGGGGPSSDNPYGILTYVDKSGVEHEHKLEAGELGCYSTRTSGDWESEESVYYITPMGTLTGSQVKKFVMGDLTKVVPGRLFYLSQLEEFSFGNAVLTGCADDFLYNMSKLNSPINFPTGFFQAQLTSSRPYFNQLSTFNSPFTFPPDATTWPSYFASALYSFNLPFTIPPQITELRSGLNSWTAFNQPITIPETVTSISNILYNANALDSVITINTTAIPSLASSCLTRSSSSSLASTPFKLTGPGAAAWKEALPDITTGYTRRQIILV